MINLHQLYHCLQYGQPGSLERLAYWLDIDCLPSDRDAYFAFVDCFEYFGGLPEKKLDETVL